jgi:hypothetical protein
MMMNRWPCAGMTLLSAVVLMLAGCTGYKLQGLVVEGRETGLQLYDQKDPRLEQLGRFGLDQATVEVTLDPNAGRRQRLDPVRTDASGRFSVPIDAFGLGMLEYEIGLLVHRPGFRPQWQVIAVPRDKQVVVLTMEPGGGSGRLEVDLLRDTLRDLPAVR